MVLQRYYIIFVTSQSFYWSCRIVCPYLWMNTHTKLINHVLLLELWEVLFVLQSGHQESAGKYFECIHQCNKIRLEQLGGARVASVLPKISTKFASHQRTLLPSVYFSLIQISLFLMGTVILSEGKQFCCQIPLIWPVQRFVFLSARKGLPCASGVSCITEEIRATLVGKTGIF